MPLLVFIFVSFLFFSKLASESPRQGALQPAPCSYHSTESQPLPGCLSLTKLDPNNTKKWPDQQSFRSFHFRWLPSKLSSLAGASNLHHPDLLTCLWPPAKNFIKAKNLFLHKPLIYYCADWDSECSKVRKSHTQSEIPTFPSAVSPAVHSQGRGRQKCFLEGPRKVFLLSLSQLVPDAPVLSTPKLQQGI